jgi:hypothetical protein
MLRSKRWRPKLGVVLMAFGLGFANPRALRLDFTPPMRLGLWLAKMGGVIRK